MDYYQAWFDLKPGVKDTDFARDLARYMAYLSERKLIEGWKLTRRKLGLAPAELGDFHLVMETKNMAQLEEAFQHVASRAEPVESVHFGVNAKVQNVALRPLPRFSRCRAPGRRREVLDYFSPPIRHTSFHSAGVTGCTDKRGQCTRLISLSLGLALQSAKRHRLGHIL